MVVNIFYINLKKTVLPAVLMGVLLFSCNLDSDPVRVQVYKSGNGWGYEIGNNKRKIIDQPFIPAVSGAQPFKTKEEAMRTGRLALEKMRDTKRLPTISSLELDSLNISYRK